MPREPRGWTRKTASKIKRDEQSNRFLRLMAEVENAGGRIATLEDIKQLYRKRMEEGATKENIILTEYDRLRDIQTRYRGAQTRMETLRAAEKNLKDWEII